MVPTNKQVHSNLTKVSDTLNPNFTLLRISYEKVLLFIVVYHTKIENISSDTKCSRSDSKQSIR